MAFVANITIDQLGDAIREEVEKYGRAITEKTRELIREAGKAALDETKAHAPVKTGKYRDSLKVTFNAKEAGGAAWSTSLGKDAGYALIYASGGQYRLTHLLENGHPMPQGGRSRAIPHWKYGEAAAEQKLEELPRKLEEVT